MDQRPTYDLKSIKQKVGYGNYRVTGTALKTADEIGLDEDDIIHVIENCLQLRDFYKTMASDKIKGLMQDVYKTSYNNMKLYVKIQLGFQGDTVVIISFKKE